MDEAQALEPKQKHRWLRRALLVSAVLLAACITACQVHHCRERLTPAVRGVVLDIETGKPIPNASVTVTVYGFPSDPIAAIASPPKWALAGAVLTTDSAGRFAFPAKTPPLKDLGISIWSYLLWGPDRKTSIGVFVWTPDYMTVLSQAEDFQWTEDPILDRWYPVQPVPMRVRRSGDLKQGFQYTVEVKRAVTEKEWEDKCRMTINNSNPSYEPGATRLFNDLTTYLERWPEGEKAGEYYMKVWETAALGTCGYMREELARGSLTKARLEVLYERACKLISLSERFQRPPKGMDADSFEKGLQFEKEVASCANKLLDGNELSSSGGSR